MDYCSFEYPYVRCRLCNLLASLLQIVYCRGSSSSWHLDWRVPRKPVHCYMITSRQLFLFFRQLFSLQTLSKGNYVDIWLHSTFAKACRYQLYHCCNRARLYCPVRSLDRFAILYQYWLLWEHRLALLSCSRQRGILTFGIFSQKETFKCTLLCQESEPASSMQIAFCFQFCTLLGILCLCGFSILFVAAHSRFQTAVPSRWWRFSGTPPFSISLDFVIFCFLRGICKIYFLWHISNHCSRLTAILGWFP